MEYGVHDDAGSADHFLFAGDEKIQRISGSFVALLKNDLDGIEEEFLVFFCPFLFASHDAHLSCAAFVLHTMGREGLEPSRLSALKAVASASSALATRPFYAGTHYVEIVPSDLDRRGGELVSSPSPGLIPEVARKVLDRVARRLDERLSDESMEQYAVHRYGIRIDAGGKMRSPPVGSRFVSGHVDSPFVLNFRQI